MLLLGTVDIFDFSFLKDDVVWNAVWNVALFEFLPVLFMLFGSHDSKLKKASP